MAAGARSATLLHITPPTSTSRKSPSSHTCGSPVEPPLGLQWLEVEFFAKQHCSYSLFFNWFLHELYQCYCYRTWEASGGHACSSGMPLKAARRRPCFARRRRARLALQLRSLLTRSRSEVDSARLQQAISPHMAWLSGDYNHPPSRMFERYDMYYILPGHVCRSSFESNLEWISII